MHRSSLLKMKAFRDNYLAPPSPFREDPLRVLDVGAMAYAAHDSHRPLFPPPEFEYIGLDIFPGPNVDLVVADPHCWEEIPTASIDVVLSGQMLEHDPQFWISLAEISRILRPGGLCCTIAPSTGPVHRFPVDCWRFYPDSGHALMSWAGLDLVESHRETRNYGKGQGIEWHDLMVIGRKPVRTPLDEEAHLERLRTIVSTRGTAPPTNTPGPNALGPAATAFELEAKAPLFRRYPYPIRVWLANQRWRLWERLTPEARRRVEMIRRAIGSLSRS
jgi:SAM-dependent methyltransferase